MRAKQSSPIIMRKNKWLTLGGWGIYVLIFSSILIILVTVIVTAVSGQWMGEENASVKRSTEAVRQTAGLLPALQAVETSQQAFLLTGQEDALKPFREGSAQMRQHLDGLSKLTQNTPEQQERLRQLITLLTEKQETLEQGITWRRSHRQDTTLHLVQPHSDKVRTNQITALVKQLEEHEEAALAKQQATFSNYINWAQGFTYLATGFNLLLLLIVLYVIHQQKTNQAYLHLHLEQSNKQWLLDTGETLADSDKKEAAGYVVQNLQKATAFIKEIGKGNFEAKLVGISEENLRLNQDNLAGELLKMQAQMRTVAEEESRRKWATEGIARFSDILRTNNKSITGLCEVLLSELIRYLQANQGGIFIVKAGITPPCLELVACYAYERKKYLQKEIQVGEGLVGQAYLEKDIIYLTEVPDRYIAITSGLGLATPTSLLIVPLLFNEQVIGVLELASFRKFAPYEIDFIRRLAESIASTISTVQTTESTQRLLREAQTMAEMLRAQEEEMRQNVEEMQTTHEVMSRKEKEHLEEIDRLHGLYEETLEDIKKKSKEYEMLSLVANNTDNSVVITDVDGLIEFVNPGFSRLTGYTLDEVKGRKPGSFLQGPDTDPKTVQRIREHLLQQESFCEEMLNYNKEGNSYWISLAINPVFDEKGQLRKFISVQSNITDTKKAALDYTSQLEAIHRAYAVVEFDTTGRVLNANENFLRLMGYRKEELAGQHHRLFVSKAEQASVGYQQLWQQLEEGNFVSGEFCRLTKAGAEVWFKGSYNSIRDVNGRPYKVVKYVQNISRQKQLEQELRQSMEEMQATVEAFEAERSQSRTTLKEALPRHKE